MMKKLSSLSQILEILMNNWQKVKLGNLINIKHGFAFKGESFSDTDNGNVVLTPGNFQIGGGFKVNWRKTKYYHGDFPEEYILQAGDLIISMTDLSKAGDTLGFPALIPEGHAKNFLHNQRLGLVESITKELDKNFIYWRLRLSDYQQGIVGSATGSTVKHTSPTRIREFEFYLPPLCEQTAIANVLSSLDGKIEASNKENETLEAIAQNLFKSWFIDFEPFGGKRPSDWEEKPLENVAIYLNGLALQKYPAKPGHPDLPVIKIAELNRGITNNTDRASAEIPSEYIIHDGDVVFSWSGSLTIVLWTSGDGALNQHLFKVSSSEYPKWFYYLWTKYHMPFFQMIAQSKATTMGHIKREHLREAKALIPDEAQMQKMTELMEPLIDKIISNSIQSRTLASTRDSLLPRLMSGKIRVPLDIKGKQ